MKKLKIYGPPGTGKTTYLLSLLEQEFKKINPTECAFVSFTKKGAYEGVQRALAQFNLARQDLAYFKTIHAICFAELGVRRYNMLQRVHYRQFGEALGMRFLGYYTEDLISNNDKFLFLEQLMRNNPSAAERALRTINVKTFAWVRANYQKFKRQLNIIDYTDLLERYLVEGVSLPVKVAFIDEAQDLTTLQWQVVNKMFSDVERLYIAGDDDQAIYEWSGADVEYFLNVGDSVKILAKSYRLPQAIHSLAFGVVDEIKKRQAKKFTSNEEAGRIKFTTSWQDIELVPKEPTLVLSRNNCFLATAEEQLKQRGLVYHKKGEVSIDPKIINAIHKYTLYSQGRLPKTEIALYASFFKTLACPEKPWFLVLNRTNDEINYYRMLLANKTPLDESSINLSTIHGAKGAESDHVVLLMDVTRQIFINLQDNPDSEFRCLYVGLTRARKKLTIKLKDTRHGFPTLPCFQPYLATPEFRA